MRLKMQREKKYFLVFEITEIISFLGLMTCPVKLTTLFTLIKRIIVTQCRESGITEVSDPFSVTVSVTWQQPMLLPECFINGSLCFEMCNEKND